MGAGAFVDEKTLLVVAEVASNMGIVDTRLTARRQARYTAPGEYKSGAKL